MMAAAALSGPGVPPLPGTPSPGGSASSSSRTKRSAQRRSRGAALQSWALAHQQSLRAWGALVGVAVLVFFVFSDGDYSFLLTLSSLVSLFSFLMVLYKMDLAQSAAGVSLKMMECYVLLFAARLFSIIPYDGYLPFDRTGDWLYQTCEALIFFASCGIVYFCRFRLRDTYNAGSDSFKAAYLVAPAALLAAVLHPSLNKGWLSNVCWAFALYLEAFAALPQLFMFQKEGRVEPFTTHFLAGQALAKLLSFLFWISTWKELNDPSVLMKRYVGAWVMIMQVVQLVVMGDFIWHYVNCLRRGISVQYILTDTV